MENTTRITTIVALVVALCFALVSLAQAGPKVAATTPIWQITQDGTNRAVNWVNADNPRFAIYDPGTPADTADDAVLDKETGLVWERSPDNTHTTWTVAVSTCIYKEVGGRLGWRLPTIEELSSLVDTTQTGPSLPAGHPFSGVESDDYWSATTTENSVTRAWATNFSTGFNNRDTKATVNNYTWCVRGGQGHDGGVQ